MTAQYHRDNGTPRRSRLALVGYATLTAAVGCGSAGKPQGSGGASAGGSTVPVDATAAVGGRPGGSGGSATSTGSGGTPAFGGRTLSGGAAGVDAGGPIGGGGYRASGGISSGGSGGAAGTSGADGGPGGYDTAAVSEAGPDVGADGTAREVGGDGPAPASITVWLAGDSTVANGSTPCPVGWGKQFQSFFGSNVKVVNSAQGGRSVQTWLYDVSTTMGSDGECVLNSSTYLGAWTTMLDGMKAGDFLFIQFGINDSDATCNRHVGTALFQKYYGRMAQAAKERGATPIFVTPASSISCNGSKAQGTRGAYAAATKQAGTTYGVTVIDLEQLSVSLYTSLGFCPLPGADTAATFEAATPVGNFFCEDHTHFEAAGAKQVAGLIVKALRDQKIVLANYLQ